MEVRLLTHRPLDTYSENGFAYSGDALTAAEVALLSAATDTEFGRDSPARTVEKDGETVRAVHGCHLVNDLFARVVRHPKLLGPAVEVLGGPVYVHQFKINAKRAVHGDVWPWHQDYIFWNRRDGMREPRAVNVAVLLDAATPVNGPLLVVPGSHRVGTLDLRERDAGLGWRSNLAADLDYRIDGPLLAELARGREIVQVTGHSGAVVLFDPQLVHASGANMSPHDRRMILVTYNRTDNLPDAVASPRPEFLAGTDYRPLEPWQGDLDN